MDFGTIRNNLKNHRYADPDEFKSDVMLVFDNCYAYNQGTCLDLNT